MPINVNVNLYGSLARLGGGKHVAQMCVALPEGASKDDLLAKLGIKAQERGYVFINALLCDVPGLDTPYENPLQADDHIGVFSIDRVWPYQYRDGVRTSATLTAALEARGAMHHSYQDDESSNSTVIQEKQDG